MNKHIGSSLTSLFDELGEREELELLTQKKLIAQDILEGMERGKVNKATLARRMRTSRDVIRRLLDPNDASVTLATLQKVSTALNMDLLIAIKKENRQTKGETMKPLLVALILLSAPAAYAECEAQRDAYNKIVVHPYQDSRIAWEAIKACERAMPPHLPVHVNGSCNAELNAVNANPDKSGPSQVLLNKIFDDCMKAEAAATMRAQDANVAAAKAKYEAELKQSSVEAPAQPERSPQEEAKDQSIVYSASICSKYLEGATGRKYAAQLRSANVEGQRVRVMRAMDQNDQYSAFTNYSIKYMKKEARKNKIALVGCDNRLVKIVAKCYALKVLDSDASCPEAATPYLDKYVGPSDYEVTDQ